MRAHLFSFAWRGHAAVLALALAALAPAAWAAPVGDRVEIDAPEALAKLLREHLDLPLREAQPDAAPRTGEPDSVEDVLAAKEALAAARAERVRDIRSLRKQIAELLGTEGYFSPRIRIAGEPLDEGGEAASPPAEGPIQVNIEPGPRAQIAAVDIRFTGAVTAGDQAERMAALRAAWSLKRGEVYRQQEWDSAKQALLQSLRAEDFPGAYLAESRAEVDPAGAAVKLSVTYESGPVFRFGELKIEGLETYDADLVRRYSNVESGGRYSQERLLELQRNLQNTPYFSSVVVEVDPESTEPTAAPVIVRVAEARPKRVSFGAGYSTNNGPRGEVAFRHANIFDRGWLLASGVRADRINQLAYADIHLPPTSKDYRDSFGILGEANDNQGLRTTRVAGGAVRTRVKGLIETRLSLTYQIEHRGVDGGGTDDRKALVLDYAWAWRGVDNVLDPRDGLVFAARVGGGAKLALSDQNFVRTHVRAQYYWPVFERDVFTLRAEAGWTAAPSRDGIPEEYLFRAGGAQSVRGYTYQSIGVREAAATVGGRYLVTGTAEYVRWFSQQWGGAVFYDTGRAADQLNTMFPLLRSYGVGARWRSPAGPLALDLAYNARDKRVRPVFSIAIAF